MLGGWLSDSVSPVRSPVCAAVVPHGAHLPPMALPSLSASLQLQLCWPACPSRIHTPGTGHLIGLVNLFMEG